MDAVAREIGKANKGQGDNFTAKTLQPRLEAIMTPWMNEGFFADVAVLVEGEDDRAAILGTAKSMKHDFDSMGIAVIPCFGKRSLDRPLVIFRRLGIPVYTVWDGDRDISRAKPEDNRYLLRLLDQPEQDWPNFIGDVCACFDVKLERTLRSELGKELFTECLSEAQSELGFPESQKFKNPAVFQCILDKAASGGKASQSLRGIVEKIVALKARTEASSSLSNLASG